MLLSLFRHLASNLKYKNTTLVFQFLPFKPWPQSCNQHNSFDFFSYLAYISSLPSVINLAIDLPQLLCKTPLAFYLFLSIPILPDSPYPLSSTAFCPPLLTPFLNPHSTWFNPAQRISSRKC